MTYHGHIENGLAVPNGPIDLPDGTPVRIELERSTSAYWNRKTVQELAEEQGVKPCVDPDDLAIDWPADESLDDFLALIRRGRV